jgi:hypothetical protein
MFKTSNTDTEPAPDVMAPADLIPITQLALDLPEPAEGWIAFLDAKGVEVVTDDIGRLSISRGDARRLFAEHRESEARKAEMRAVAERRAIESDRQWRAQLPRGVPWYEIPPGVLPVVAMTQADRDATAAQTVDVGGRAGGRWADLPSYSER